MCVDYSKQVHTPNGSLLPFHTIKKKQKIKTEKCLGGQMDGAGKKMSEQAPGYFSFYFTRWQYVKNREKKKRTLKFEGGGGCV